MDHRSLTGNIGKPDDRCGRGIVILGGRTDRIGDFILVGLPVQSHLHMDVVFLCIIDDAGIIALGLGDDINILAFCIEHQLPEGKGAVRRILHFIQHIALGISQDEGEQICSRNLPVQSLGALEDQCAALPENVAELQLAAATDSSLGRQSAGVLILGDRYGNGVNGGIVYHIRQVAGYFPDGINVAACFAVRQCAKPEGAVCGICHSFQQVTGLVHQFEGEFAFLQAAAGQVLHALQGHRHIIGGILVGELQDLAGHHIALIAHFEGDRSLGIDALALHGGDHFAVDILNGNGHLIVSLIVGDTLQSAPGFLHHIIVGAHGAVFDMLEAEAAVGCVGSSLDGRLTRNVEGRIGFIQLEGKLTALQGTALQDLHALDANLAMVVVDDGQCMLQRHIAACNVDLTVGHTDLDICDLGVVLGRFGLREDVAVAGRNVVKDDHAVLTGYSLKILDLRVAAAGSVGQRESGPCQEFPFFIDLSQAQDHNTTVLDHILKGNGIHGFAVSGDGPGDLIAVFAAAGGYHIGHGVNGFIVIHIVVGARLLGDGVGVGAGLIEGQLIEGDHTFIIISPGLDNLALAVLQQEGKCAVPDVAAGHCLDSGQSIRSHRGAEIVGEGDLVRQMVCAAGVRLHRISVDDQTGDFQILVLILRNRHGNRVNGAVVDHVGIGALDFPDPVAVSSLRSKHNGVEDELTVNDSCLRLLCGRHIDDRLKLGFYAVLHLVQLEPVCTIGRGAAVQHGLDALQNDLGMLHIHVDDLDHLIAGPGLHGIDIELAVNIGHMAGLSGLVCCGLIGFGQQILVAGDDTLKGNDALFVGLCDNVSDLIVGTANTLHMGQGKPDALNGVVRFIDLHKGEAARCVAGLVGKGLLITVDHIAVAVRNGCLEGAAVIGSNHHNGSGDGLSVIGKEGICSLIFGDGNRVGACPVKGQRREEHLTLVIVFGRHRLSVAGCGKCKLRILQRSALQDLVHFQDHGSRLAGPVAEGQGSGLAALLGNADSGFRHQCGALLVLLHMNMHMVHSPVIDDGAVGACLFGHGIQVLTGFPEGQFGEAEAAVSLVGNGFKLHAVDIGQHKGEVTGIHCPASQRLGAVDGHPGRCHIPVCKAQRTGAVNGNSLFKFAGRVIIGHYDLHIVNGSIVGHAGLAACLLVNPVFEGSDAVEGQLGEAEGAVCLILCSFQEIAILVSQHEGKCTGLQRLSAQGLLTGDHMGDLFGGKGIGEVIVLLLGKFLLTDLCHQPAVAVIHHIHSDLVDSGIIRNAAQSVLYLIDGVGVGTGFGIDDGLEGVDTACVHTCIVDSLKNGIAFLQLKGELAGQQHSAVQCLGAAQSQRSGSGLIGIAEGGSFAGRIFIIVICRQCAVALVRNLHHQVVDSAVIGHAALAALHLGHIIAVGAHLGKGQCWERNAAVGIIFGGSNGVGGFAVVEDGKFELTCHQASAAQLLVGHQAHGCGSRCIGIGEFHPLDRIALGIGNGNRSGNILSPVLFHYHGNMVFTAVIGPAGSTAGSFLQDVVMGAFVIAVHGPGKAGLACAVGGFGVDRLAVFCPAAVRDGGLVQVKPEALLDRQRALGLIGDLLEYV